MANYVDDDAHGDDVLRSLVFYALVMMMMMMMMMKMMMMMMIIMMMMELMMAMLRVIKTDLVGADYGSPSSSLGLLSLFLMSSGRQLEFALFVHTCKDGPNPDSLLREVVPPWCHVEVEFSCLLDRVFDFLMEASNRPPLTFGIGRRLVETRCA